ncbi:MAG: GH25 family lysozyme [Pseudomonadota bacterium]|nr:GH25 family lysozyme [Pseudomonadota bacterium]
MRRVLPPSAALAVAALAVAALALAGVLYTGVLWFNMPSRARWPIRGLDVSHHQGPIDWAAYTFCRPAADQAANFLSVVPREADALPPVVDVEFGGNCAARPARDTLLAELAVYRDAVEAGLGRRPVLYATGDLARSYQLSDVAWVRDIFREPAPPWTVWQYSQRERVAGIDGYVDVNVFGGDEAAFARLVR